MNTAYPANSPMQIHPARSAALSDIAQVLNAERERIEQHADRAQSIADRTFGSIPTAGAGPNGPPMETPTVGGMMGEIQTLLYRIRAASSRLHQHLDRIDNGL